MGSNAGAALEYCEHDELRAACLECLAMPQKVTPQQMSAPRATKNPTSENDKISPLGGELDVSLPVEAIEPFVGSEWLPAHTFPHYLRRSGWIYLRCDDTLMARVKAVKMVWQAERKVPTPDAYEDRGPGLAIQVDAKTWDSGIAIPLGVHAENQRHGYRYLMTNDDDSVTHYRGGRPIPETGLADDEFLDD